jgi:hypothetical protein
MHLNEVRISNESFEKFVKAFESNERFDGKEGEDLHNKFIREDRCRH